MFEISLGQVAHEVHGLGVPGPKHQLALQEMLLQQRLRFVVVLVLTVLLSTSCDAREVHPSIFDIVLASHSLGGYIDP